MVDRRSAGGLILFLGLLLGATAAALVLTRDAPRRLPPCSLLRRAEVDRLGGAPLVPHAAGGGITCVYSLNPPHTVVSSIHATPPYVTVATRPLTDDLVRDLNVPSHQARQLGWEVVPVEVGDEAVVIRDNRLTKRRTLQAVAGDWYVEVEVGTLDHEREVNDLLVKTVRTALLRRHL